MRAMFATNDDQSSKLLI